jgi:hypothetical protein
MDARAQTTLGPALPDEPAIPPHVRDIFPIRRGGVRLHGDEIPLLLGRHVSARGRPLGRFCDDGDSGDIQRPEDARARERLAPRPALAWSRLSQPLHAARVPPLSEETRKSAGFSRPRPWCLRADGLLTSGISRRKSKQSRPKAYSPLESAAASPSKVGRSPTEGAKTRCWRRTCIWSPPRPGHRSC